MKKIILGILLLSTHKSFSQNVLFETFSSLNNAQLSGQNGWSNNSLSGNSGVGACAGAICLNTPVVSQTMNYAGFQTVTKALNPIHNTNGDGVGKFLGSSINSGSVYVAIMVNLSNASTGTGLSSATQLFRLMDNGLNVPTRLYITSTGGGFKIAVDKSSSFMSSFSSSIYGFNTTHLIVLKYTFNAGTADDEIKVYMNPNLAAAEPVSAELTFTNGGANDIANITRLVFPWNNGTIPTGFIGAVSVSRSWGQTLPNPFVTNIQVNKSSNNKASISWDVANNSEVNNFTIQHSTNNNNFNDVGRIDYNGNTKFNQNIDLANGTNYIRLATTNKQGNTIYSQVFVVKSGSVIGGLTISPNPTKGMLLATIKTEERDALQLQVLDLQGKLIHQQTSNVEKGETQVSVDVNNLKAGQYILKVVGKTTAETKLFVKQ